MCYKNDRADQLQFLRFLAFMLVFLKHSDLWTPYWFPKYIGSNCAVSFFFILSGVVKAYSSYNKQNKCTFTEIKKNIYRKLKKIYPLFFVTTLIAFACSDVPLYIACHDVLWEKELKQLFTNLLLLHSWIPHDYFSYNGVSWFLSTIMFMYILELPLITQAEKIKKTKYNILSFVVIVLMTVGCITCYCYMVKSANNAFWLLYVFPPARLGEFIIGISLGYIVRILKDSEIAIDKWVFTFVESIALALWIFMLYVPFIEWKGYIVHWILPNSILLFVFSIGKGHFSTLFCNYRFKHLGNISFECFMIHYLVTSIYYTKSRVGDISMIGNMISIVLCFSITLLIANGISKTSRIEKSS